MPWAALDNREQFNSGFRLPWSKPRDPAPFAICRSLQQQGGMAGVSLGLPLPARLGSARLGSAQPEGAQKQQEDRSLTP